MGLERIEVTPRHFQFLANRANAAKSTGPRTARGKEISSANAIKHGFRSTHPSLDENIEEIQAARERFVNDLKPRGEVALVLCELAYRQKRQLERVLAAEDSAVYFRLGELENLIRGDRERFMAEAVAKFDAAPVEGQALLRVCIDGIDHLIQSLADFERAVGAGRWEPAYSAKLLAIEESEIEREELFDRATVLCDELRNDARALAELGDGDPDPTHERLTRTMHQSRLQHARTEFEPIKRLIVDRIQSARRRLENELVETRLDEGLNARRLADYTKFDVSHGAQLRRRYISQAQRDFMKALEAAIKATGWKMNPNGSSGSYQASIPPVPMPRPREVARRVPNEPVSRRDDRAGRDEKEAPSTNVEGRERA